MRRILLPFLILGLVAGCSVPKIGPHRIDVQQGNALDQENVARLKIGLNRAQVRFLLGTPLVVDPFRTDRWDYVYLYYKSGQLTEQKRITLFFDGDTLARIEGDLPEAGPVATPAPRPPLLEKAEPAPSSGQAPVATVAEPGPPPSANVTPAPARPAPVVKPADGSVSARADAVPAAPVTRTALAAPANPAAPSSGSSIVAPLPSPPNAPPYVDPRVPPEPAPGMVVETDIERIRPDVIPPFPDTASVTSNDDEVLKAVDAWAKAWAARDEAAYLAAYDAGFVPAGDASREAWEKRRRLLLGMSRNIDLRVDSPSVERNDDGSATVTFNQFYRSDSYRDAVVKQLRLVERDGSWRIVEEKVLSILRGARS